MCSKEEEKKLNKKKTFHTCGSSLDSLIKRLELDANLAIEWFNSNYMKLNQSSYAFWP